MTSAPPPSCRGSAACCAGSAAARADPADPASPTTIAQSAPSRPRRPVQRPSAEGSCRKLSCERRVGALAAPDHGNSRSGYLSRQVAASATCRRRARSGHRRNSIPMSANALISSALPEGSRKNIVACSPGSPLEPDVRLDDELDALRLQARGQRFPFGHRQHDAEMAHRHASPSTAFAGPRPSARRQVRDDLVAVEVEVHPVVRASALGAAEHFAVEPARQREVVHREREVERGQRGGVGGGSTHVCVAVSHPWRYARPATDPASRHGEKAAAPSRPASAWTA